MSITVTSRTRCSSWDSERCRTATPCNLEQTVLPDHGATSSTSVPLYSIKSGIRLRHSSRTPTKSVPLDSSSTHWTVFRIYGPTCSASCPMLALAFQHCCCLISIAAVCAQDCFLDPIADQSSSSLCFRITQMPPKKAAIAAAATKSAKKKKWSKGKVKDKVRFSLLGWRFFFFSRSALQYG